MRNITIGLTGGIGSGKSVVARILRCNGLPVYDCDSQARFLMENDLNIKGSLKEELGENIYFADGALNRRKLADKLFSDGKIRDFVNGIVHKAVKTDILNKRRFIGGRFYIESAILSTGGLVPLCDQIWVVTAENDEKKRRVKMRDGLKEEEIEKRMVTQEKEISALDSSMLITIENGLNQPILEEVLIKSEKYINNQTYIISC